MSEHIETRVLPGCILRATEDEKAQCDIHKEHHPSKSYQSVNGYLISIC